MGIIERKEREREARRGQILAAAQKVFQDRGLTQTSMDDIAKEAELAKGTIYLYYKNKDELLLGLILRGFEILYDLMLTHTGAEARGLGRIMAVGNAYREFSMTEKFLFSLMNVSEPPPKSNVSGELIDELGYLTEQIWKMFYQFTEQAKADGDLKPEVNGFTLVLTLWLSSTGVLRMYNKCLCNVDNNAFAARKGGMHLEYLDWAYVYDTTTRMLLETAVTEQGRTFLAPLTWKTNEEMGLGIDANVFHRAETGHVQEVTLS